MDNIFQAVTWFFFSCMLFIFCFDNLHYSVCKNRKTVVIHLKLYIWSHIFSLFAEDMKMHKAG